LARAGTDGPAPAPSMARASDAPAVALAREGGPRPRTLELSMHMCLFSAMGEKAVEEEDLATEEGALRNEGKGEDL